MWPKQDDSKRDYVKEFRVKQLFIARARFWSLFALMLLALIVGTTLLVRDPPDVVVRSVTGLTGFVALAVAAWQWRAARHESAIDKFYERMKLANEMRLQAAESAFAHGRDVPIVTHGARDYADLAASFYVFTEIDNLEYCLHKYRYGFATRRITNRALETLQNRCDHLPEFREKVRILLMSGSYQALEVSEAIRQAAGIAKSDVDNARAALQGEANGTDRSELGELPPVNSQRSARDEAGVV